ncbi:MAG: sugar phosphate isomerase/epimerase [Ruminococcaceae bacterium]|nr:sugar phosphate isomerase/epimerase [Oscillospiraceae bacterium]
MELYCSTGVFLGRMNGGNYHLLTEYGHRLHCDGFEYMMFPMWYGKEAEMVRELVGSGLRFPVFHADKSVGDDISSLPDDAFSACVDKWQRNLETAAGLGAGKVVTHIWGIPDSDKYAARLYERVLRLREIAAGYGLDMLGENCCCTERSPLPHFRELQRMEPGLGFTIDTRPAQFHQELEDLCAEDALWQGAVRHLHLSDYHGGLKDWKALYPIPAPGRGDVDYPRFFAHLKKVQYQGSASLESPCMNPDRLDWETINTYLDYLREGLGELLG